MLLNIYIYTHINLWVYKTLLLYIIWFQNFQLYLDTHTFTSCQGPWDTASSVEQNSHVLCSCVLIDERQCLAHSWHLLPAIVSWVRGADEWRTYFSTSTTLRVLGDWFLYPFIFLPLFSLLFKVWLLKFYGLINTKIKWEKDTKG